MKTIFFDVMLNDRFVHTMKYKCPDNKEISEAMLHDYVISKLPTLKNKDFKIYLYDKRH